MPTIETEESRRQSRSERREPQKEENGMWEAWRGCQGTSFGLVKTKIYRGRGKPINMNNFSGLSPEWVGVNFVYVLPFSWGKRETHKQNSQEIPGKGRDSPRDSPGIIL